MAILGETGAVTGMNLRCLPERLGGSLAIVMGMAAVVGVAVSLLSMAAGLLAVISNTGRPDRAVVVTSGTGGLGGGAVSRSDALLLADAPQVRRGEDGKPLVSSDVAVPVLVNRKTDGMDTVLPLWAIGAQGMAMRAEVKIVEGRMFTPALHEVIVGRSAQTRIRDVGVGGHILLPGGEWTVVGLYEGGGGLLDGSILAEAESVMAAFRRNSFSTVTVQLNQATDFDAFKEWVQSNAGLQALDVKRENQYYYDQFKEGYGAIRLVAYGLGIIMAIGATFGALNTMYSAVSARSIETATLRAIGFGGGSILLSVMAEAMLLAVSGALLGLLLAWLVFNGHELKNMPMLSITLIVTPTHLLSALGFGLAVGTLGGLFPAIRAVRLPVVAALRSA